ncbi:MAG: hypothetical protein Q9166_005148 [cf. Caloplaca sp. 2 TL-2023]
MGLPDRMGKQPMTFMSLPLELRQRIYGLALRSNFNQQIYWPVVGIRVIADYHLDIALPLTSTRIRAEIIEYYKDTVYTRLYPQGIFTPGEYSEKPVLQYGTVNLSPAPCMPRVTNIKRWCLHLVDPFLGYDHYHRNSALSWIKHFDGIAWVLAASAHPSPILIIQIPCLCASTNPSNLKRYSTSTAWMNTFSPLFERLLKLPLRSTFHLVPTRQLVFPPCPLRKCKALASLIEDLRKSMGDQTTATVDQLTTLRVGNITVNSITEYRRSASQRTPTQYDDGH